MLPLFLFFQLAAAPYAQLLHLYDYDRSAPLDLQQRGVKQQDGLAIHDITYASPRGGRVAAWLVVPPGPGPFPAVLFQHGGGGNRSSFLPGALRLAKEGAVCLLIDAALHGERAIPGENLLDLRQPERLRKGMIQTVIDQRRGIDLLTARREVDPQRIGYIGGSFGAICGGVLAGVDHRAKAFVLISGAASLRDIFHNGSNHPNVVATRKALTPEQIGRALDIIEDAEPVHYVGHAAPSALRFENGYRDTFITVPAGKAFQKAGSEPKEMIWYDAGHALFGVPQAFEARAEWLRKQIGIGHTARQ